LTDQKDVDGKPRLGLHRFSIGVACLTLVLLMAGALVTSNEAGDSVPDWPLSFGRWLIHSDYFVANVRYEYSHRVIAGLVGFATFILAAWAWKSERRSWVKRLALIAFAGVVLQALIGGVRVLFPEYKALIAVPHALIAQSFFGLIVAIAVFTSRGWQSRSDTRPDYGRPGLRTISVITVAAMLIQLVLGAGFRHQAFGIVPHVIGAIAVTFLIGMTASSVLSRSENDSYLRRPAIAAPVLLIAQVALGIGAYLARVKSAGAVQPLEPLISLTAGHVVVGALTLANMIVLMLRCHRVLVSEGERTGEMTSSAGIGSRAAV
jgi:cytochrome c oxidase assembly protein subunit 15